MAEILKTFISFADLSGELALMSASGSDFFTLDNADHRLVLIAQNTNAQAATVTLKAGDGSLSSMGDASVRVNGGKSAVIPLSRVESARIKRLDGDDKGKAFVVTAVDAGGGLSNVTLGVISIE
jgi:hypothetical protein